MKAKVFTLRFDTTSRTIDDTAFQGFIEDRELLSLSDHIVEFDREPMMVLCVTYRDVMEPVNRTPPFVSRKSNPRDRLDDTEKALFDVLRLWRNKRAEAVCGFLERGGQRAIITDPHSLSAALRGLGGTHIIGGC